MDQRNSINNVKLKKIKIMREKLFIISLMHNNTKVDYLVEGILFVKYQVTYKNPITQKDTVDIKHLYKTISQTGTYNY
jgi:hypothetical protein